MDRIKKYNDIVSSFSLTDISTITLNNGTTHQGIFDRSGYENEEQLTNSQTLLFIPKSNMPAHQNHYSTTGKKNIDLCLLIDVADIVSVTTNK